MLDDFAKALELEEKMFEKVKKYLEDHPGEALEEVADNTEVRDKIILKWIDQGRIQIGGEHKRNSESELADEFRKLQSTMGKGGGSRFDNASKVSSMHISQKKK